MKNTRTDELSDRRKTAADAKAALLQAFRAAKEAAEPTRLARQAERQAIASAREEQRAARKRVKAEERERIQKEAAERKVAMAAAARAEIVARETADRKRISEFEAVLKAKRDRRYASRKARQA